MPPLFRSRQPYDREVDRGHALAELMKKLGRKPLAVVPQYFPERKRDLPIGDLLVGFDDVAIYKRDAQNEQRRMIEARLEAAKDTPFFAWLHYYAMHVPGWDGQRIPLNQPAWPANYQRPLKWVDGQIHALFDKLKALGIDRRTMVVFTSDHGEGLLDNGMLTHGGSLAEVAVRVPLAFYIPGQKPRVIEHTVGNIDIVPTLHDLLGGDAHPEYAGRSLVPLFTDPRGAWSRSYFTVAGRQKGISLVRGTHKHVMDRTANVHFHFDLESDPREEHDLFDPGKRDHLTLLHEVVAAVPGWFATEHAKRWDKLFRRRLEEVNPRRPPEALPTLLKLIHAARAKKYLVPVQRWYREAVDDRVRVLILREVFRRDPKGFTELLVEQLTPIADTPRAAAFVEELSGYEGPYRAAQKVLNDARTARPAPLAPP